MHNSTIKHVADDFFLQAALAAGQGCESPVQGPCRRRRSAVEEKSAVEQLSAVEGLSAQELEQRLDTMYNQVIQNQPTCK